jgi:hypothetical protein
LQAAKGTAVETDTVGTSRLWLLASSEKLTGIRWRSRQLLLAAGICSRYRSSRYFQAMI